MPELDYPRGSEWNIWDLHVHTPASHTAQYGGDKDKAWRDFIKDLENLDESIKVIGINDYWFIDGYKRVLEEKNNGRLKNIDLILPVVEFRIDKLAGVEFKNNKRINLHIIFSDQISTDTLQNQFLNTIHDTYHLSSKFPEDFWRGNVTYESIAELGKKIKESSKMSENWTESDFELGFNNLTVNRDDLLKKLNRHYFNGKYLIAIGKTEWDEIKWTDSSISDKKDIINKSHIIFTASESVEKYNNAKQKLSENGVNDLLLDCSDAHHFSNSDHKDRIGNCKTWIKANTTFEGLKQILYDKSRIKVQETRPEQRPPYSYISCVRFKGTSDDFSDAPIYFNPNLNSIIGGKSSGKSLLLHTIAKTIDEKLVEDINKIYDPKNNSEKYVKIYEKTNFEVEWADGEIYKLNDDDSKKERQITYLPQMYINKALEEGSKELNKLILDILSENNKFRDDKKELDLKISKIKAKLDGTLSEIDSSFKIYYDEMNILKSLGSKEAVDNEIDRLNKLINESKSGMTEEERNNYLDLKNLENELSGQSLKTAEYIKCLKLFLIKYEECSEKFLREIYNFALSTALLGDNNYVNELDIIKHDLRISFESNVSETVLTKVNSIIDLQTEMKNKQELKIKDIRLELAKYEDKLQLESVLQENTQKLYAEITKRENIVSKKKSIEIITSELSKLKNQLISEYKSIFETYDEFSEMLSKNYSEMSKDIELKSNIEFNSKEFSDIFYKGNNKFYSIHSPAFENKIYKYDKNSHFSVIENILDDILSSYFKNNSQNIIKSGDESYKSKLSQLFSDYFKINYNLKYENDLLSDMSPGKKGTVILKLYLVLSNSTHPILIDQPEDNLDNRTISENLVKFIEDRKSRRQIIMVSHNSNLVVSTDSENVIVANQSGYAGQRDNAHHTFEYVSGALENTYDPHERCMKRIKDICDENCSENTKQTGILFNRGIREHIFEILEGGKEAFKKRESKYGMGNDAILK